MRFLWFIRKLDKTLIATSVLLALFGVVSLIGMAHNNPLLSAYRNKQILFLGVGIISMIAVAFVDYRALKNNSYAVMLLYGITTLGLVAVLFTGSNIRGATSWLRIGEFAFGPVEFSKIALIVLLAKYFSTRHIELHRFFHVVVSFFYVALPFALVLAEPDFGSAIILFALWLGMLFFSGLSKKYIIFLIIMGVVVSLFAWTHVLKPYQKDRIFTFLNVQKDPQGSGYNVLQSLIAVGDGGAWGKGLGYGSQVQLGFLPEARTDFMFASIAEEFGFAGVCALIFLLSLLLWRIMRIGIRAENNFAGFFCVGMILLIGVQVFINMGMNMGMVPVTGIPFPFISYGGSSLVSLFLGIGIIQSIVIRSSWSR